MGKRRHEDRDNAYDHDDYYRDREPKRRRRSKRKHKRSRRRRRYSSSSTSSTESRATPMPPYDTDGLVTEWDPVYDEFIDGQIQDINTIPDETENTEPAHPTSSREMPSTSSAAGPQDPNPPLAEATAEPAAEPDPRKNDILGEDPTIVKKYAAEIDTDLASRLEYYVTNGLAHNQRKELLERYLPPSNCTSIDAPLMNPEMLKAVTDAVLKRDKAIEIKQKQLGAAISCVSSALTILIKDRNSNSAVGKLLMDASRLLGDCQYLDSNTRRNFVLFNLKKDMKDQVQKSKIDSYLFGSDLSETLKTGRQICKSGAELKNTHTPRLNTAPRNNRPFHNQAQQQHRNNLNWKPPPNRRPRGPPRGRDPVPPPPPRAHQAHSSRPSYRDKAQATYYRPRH